MDFEQWRNVEVDGPIGKIIFRTVGMPRELAEAIWLAGGSVPLDVVPNEFWREPGAEWPRYSEEMVEDS